MAAKHKTQRTRLRAKACPKCGMASHAPDRFCWGAMWVPLAQVQAGDSVKDAGNHRLWETKAHAVVSSKPWRLVAAVERPHSRHVLLRFADGGISNHASQARALVSSGRLAHQPKGGAVADTTTKPKRNTSKSKAKGGRPKQPELGITAAKQILADNKAAYDAYEQARLAQKEDGANVAELQATMEANREGFSAYWRAYNSKAVVAARAKAREQRKAQQAADEVAKAERKAAKAAEKEAVGGQA